jgi:hypothetical protein
MQQAKREATHVVGAKRDAGLLKELAEIGTQLNHRGWLASAGRASFKQDAAGDFAGTAEARRVGEAVAGGSPSSQSSGQWPRRPRISRVSIARKCMAATDWAIVVAIASALSEGGNECGAGANAELASSPSDSLT